MFDIETAMKDRRKELFSRLGDVLSGKEDRGKLILYVMELWKYIADVHGEEISVEVNMDVFDDFDDVTV